MKENVILNEVEYGFRYDRSTDIALFELIEDITDALENKKHTVDGLSIYLKCLIL